MSKNTIIHFTSLDSDAKTLSISFEYQNDRHFVKFPPPETNISKGNKKTSVFFLFRAHMQECLQDSIEVNNQCTKNSTISTLSSDIWKELPYAFKNEFSKYTNRVNEYRTSKEQNPFISSDDNLSKKVIRQQNYYQRRTYEDIHHTEASTYSVTNDDINGHFKNGYSSLETTTSTSLMVKEPMTQANLSFESLNKYEECEFWSVHSSVDETMCLDVNTTNYLEAYYGTPSPVNSSVYEMRGMESINISPLNVFKSAPLQRPADFSCQSLVTPNGHEVFGIENTELTHNISLTSLDLCTSDFFRSNNSVIDNLYDSDWLMYEDKVVNPSFDLPIPNRREVDSMDDISKFNINLSELALRHMENSTGYEMH
ncbi:15862_t:CDS:1 [Gigaspora margarita]|uniref:15862_t:CDS:1 n=1 Tax=Gigaspora margarita TaxID=4874 RepID=A0ABN7VJP8_GIGMA|nr:15862_t:CDS:1 [Gigaspora margarita]